MKLVAQNLELPLFLKRRYFSNYESVTNVENYIKKYRKHFKNSCQKNHEFKEDVRTQRDKHLVGLDKTNCKVTSPYKSLSKRREIFQTKEWNLAPNRYNVSTEPYKKFKGSTGACWPKLPSYEKNQTGNCSWMLRNVHEAAAPIKQQKQRHTFVFSKTARDGPPTSRIILKESKIYCEHEKRPDVCSYYPKLHELSYKVSSKNRVNIRQPVSYKFYRNSCVPIRVINGQHPVLSCYKPGPTRYENRYKCPCFCSSKREYFPDFPIYLEYQKRLRFRRLKYERLKSRLYCSPDWLHVKGRGFKHLFKLSQFKTQDNTKPAKKWERKKNKSLYATDNYINMINNPKRNTLSLFEQSVLDQSKLKQSPEVALQNQKFVRKNKKSHFGSGLPRFADDVVPLPLNREQFKKIVKSLPKELQFRCSPTMTKKPNEITSRLAEIPPRHRFSSTIKMRKNTFKFLPLPTPVILSSNLKQLYEEIEASKRSYFGMFLRPSDYVKEDTVLPESLAFLNKHTFGDFNF